MKKLITALSILIISLLSAFSVNASNNHSSKYMGQEQRAIKALSDEDIKDLQNGRGWGLAKAAELNGVPGPSHVLDMEKEIQLSEQQKSEINSIFKSMQSQAKESGLEFIDKEKEINTYFSTNNVDEKQLRQMITASADAYGQLRLIHLRAHTSTAKVLTDSQITLYNKLRGYTEKHNPNSNGPNGSHKHGQHHNH